ncbi:MAG: leucine-rich repeat protein [Bacteroidales bacterium]|nr:leucine-rich repeat protein [Bacteroidales bacterium]
MIIDRTINRIMVGAIMALAMIFYSCGGGGGSSEPSSKTYSISLSSSTTSYTFDSNGGSESIYFTASGDSWKAQVNASASWISVSPSSGVEGSGSITIKVNANTDYSERNGSVTISCGTASKTITVVQKQLDALLATSERVELAADGGSFEISYQANVSDVTYEISADGQSWITYSSSRALSDHSFTFLAEENPKEDSRSATIKISSATAGKTETVTVYQYGNVPTLLLTNKNIEVASTGGTVTVELKANTTFEVSGPDVDWITETTSRAFSYYTYKYTVSANTGYDSRQAQITFYNQEEGLSQTCTITQAQLNAIIIGDNSYEFSCKANTLEVEVQANVDYTVSISDSWVQQTGSRALSSKTLIFSIEANAAEQDRQCTITIASSTITKTITVKQRAYTSLSVNVSGGKAEVDLGASYCAPADVAILVKEAVDQGVTEISISGDIQSLGFGTDNCVFRDEILGASGQIKLDFTNAEGWPSDENGYAQVPDEAFKSVQGIKEVVLGKNVQAIGRSAFTMARYLESISAEGLVMTHNFAFQYCYQLQDVYMPNLKETGRCSFHNCNLTKITEENFPSLTKLGGSSFWYCENVTEVDLPYVEYVGVQDYEDTESTDYTAGMALANLTNCTRINLPKATFLGKYAVAWNPNLEELNLPEVKTLHSNALYECPKIVDELRLPSCTSIANHAINIASLDVLYLTSPDDIEIDEVPFGFQSRETVLHLNINKEDEVEPEPYLPYKIWRTLRFKDIIFEE